MLLDERNALKQPVLEGSACECGGTYRRGDNGHLFCEACGSEVAVKRREVNVFTCLRCGHEWVTRKDVTLDGLPRRCARCRTPDWNKPYTYHKQGKPAPTKDPKPRGRHVPPRVVQASSETEASQ